MKAALHGAPVITGAYPVTWITSLCEPIRGARLFDRCPAVRAAGQQTQNWARSRQSHNYRKLTFTPRCVKVQPTPQEGSHGTHS